MLEPPFPPDEVARQLALQRLAVLDTPPDERFDRLTRLARRAFDAPVALVSLVDGDRQWFKSCLGLDVSETPRAISFCGHAILDSEPLVVPDALADPRFADNPLVMGEPGVRFYAGAPIHSPEGHAVGTLCVIDFSPRAIGPDDVCLLVDLAALVARELAGAELAAALRARQQAEEALWAAQDFMRATLDALQEHVAIVDASGVVVAVNGTWRRSAEANGFKGPRHGIGMNYLEVCDRAAPFSPEAAEVARGLRELLAGGRETLQVEYPCHGPGGMSWFVASLSRFAGEGPVHVVVSHADITARKYAEQALAVEKAFVEATLDNIPVQVSMLGADGRLRWANREAGRMLGRSPEALVGSTLQAVYGLGDAELEQLRAGLETTEPRYLQGFAVRTPQGEVACDLALRRVPDGLVALGVDVSARVLNERLQQAQIASLRQMDALKDEFLGSVSHEFRAPLHAIMGIANILATEVDGPLSDRQRKDMADLLASAEDLAHLIDDLLALSQLRAGRFSLNPRPTDMRAIGAAVLAGMAPLAAMGQRVLVLDAPETLPVVVDEARVAQVLRNLVHNAIKFTHPMGRITLRLRLEAGGLRGEVEDDGIGVDAADFERLFERFSQLAAGKAAGGTGLGLSICKGLVEAQGGAIGLLSEPGRGSTFWFTLPAGVTAGR